MFVNFIYLYELVIEISNKTKTLTDCLYYMEIPSKIHFSFPNTSIEMLWKPDSYENLFGKTTKTDILIENVINK